MRKTVIAEQIWAGRPPRRWQVTLESYVALLRRAIQPGVPGAATVLCTTPGGYRVDIDRVAIDLHDYDLLVRRAVHAAPEEALPLWERAVEIADGALLAAEPCWPRSPTPRGRWTRGAPTSGGCTRPPRPVRRRP